MLLNVSSHFTPFDAVAMEKLEKRVPAAAVVIKPRRVDRKRRITTTATGVAAAAAVGEAP